MIVLVLTNYHISVSIQEKIKDDLKNALREGKSDRVSVLRFLQAKINNERLNTGTAELAEDKIIKVIQKEVKKRSEAADAFKKGERMEEAEKEEAEKKILEGYLPAQLSDEEIEKIISEVIAALPADKREVGMVMKEVMSELKGRADGTRVRQIAERVLNT